MKERKKSLSEAARLHEFPTLSSCSQQLRNTIASAHYCSICTYLLFLSLENKEAAEMIELFVLIRLSLHHESSKSSTRSRHHVTTHSRHSSSSYTYLTATHWHQLFYSNHSSIYPLSIQLPCSSVLFDPRLTSLPRLDAQNVPVALQSSVQMEL